MFTSSPGTTIVAGDFHSTTSTAASRCGPRSPSSSSADEPPPRPPRTRTYGGTGAITRVLAGQRVALRDDSFGGVRSSPHVALGALTSLRAGLFGARARSSPRLRVERRCSRRRGIVHTRAGRRRLPLLLRARPVWRPRARRAGWLGLACAVALCVKFSMIVVAPVVAAGALALLVLAPRLGLPRGRVVAHAALVACVVLLVVNAAYYFQSPPIIDSDVRWVQLKSAPVFGSDAGFHALEARPTSFLFGSTTSPTQQYATRPHSSARTATPAGGTTSPSPSR